MADRDRLRELEEKYEGYKVYDNNGDSIGKVDDLFVDDADREQYIGIKMGLFGLSGTTLIPMELVRVNEGDRVIEVAESKDRVKDAPQYSDDDEIDHSFEARIREHFGLGGAGAEGAVAGDNTMRGDELGGSEGGSREPVGREEYQNRDDSDSAMSSAAGGAAATSGGVNQFETGEREGRGEYREGEQGESSGRQEYREGERGSEGASGGGVSTGSGDDPKVRGAYMEGYREAIRDVHGQSGGSSGTSGSSGGEQGGSGDERQAASEHFGAPAAGPGEKEFDDMQDYQSATTGYQPSRGEGESGEGRMRVRRLRRGS